MVATLSVFLSVGFSVEYSELPTMNANGAFIVATHGKTKVTLVR